MALIPCPECGKMISDKAKFCPACGYPLQATFYNDQESLLYNNCDLQSSSPDSLNIALNHAKDFLEVGAISKKGMIDLLKYVGYPEDAAIYAAANCNADWNMQAVLKIKEYLSIMKLSRQEMIGQLEFDGFTSSEIQYAIQKMYK